MTRFEHPLAKAIRRSVLGGKEGDCWLWQGCVNSKGYPTISAGRSGRTQLLTRALLAAQLGRPVRGVARHTCDTPQCCNPAHLLEGSQKDNADDARERNRLAKGTRNGRVTIDENMARGIKQALRNGARIAHTARVFGVARHIVCGINKGMQGKDGGTWAWL